MPSIRKSVSIALLAGFLALGAVVMRAQAVPTPRPATYETETTYFNNAAHSTEVGWRIRTCSGQNYFSGRVTAYVQKISTLCPNGS